MRVNKKANDILVQSMNEFLEGVHASQIQKKLEAAGKSGIFDRETIIGINFASKGWVYPESKYFFSQFLAVSTRESPFHDARAQVLYTLGIRIMDVLRSNPADRQLTWGQNKELLEQAKISLIEAQHIMDEHSLFKENYDTLIQAQYALVELVKSNSCKEYDLKEYLIDEK